jgi:hypothetical protein
MNRRIFAIAIVAACTSGCRIALPSYIYPEQYENINVKPALKVPMGQCAIHLNQLRWDAAKSSTLSDILTIIGGGVAISGSTSAAIIDGTKKDGDDSAKVAAIVSASVAGAGALIAVLAKAIDSPTFSLDKHAKSERHWAAGFKATSGADVAGMKTQIKVNPNVWIYASNEFSECQSESPSKDVPTPPLLEENH